MMPVRLSPLQARVYFIIKQHGPIGPTKIGTYLNVKYENCSQHVSRPIQKLVRSNLVGRQKKNNRVVLYHALHEIDPPIELQDEGGR